METYKDSHFYWKRKSDDYKNKKLVYEKDLTFGQNLRYKNDYVSKESDWWNDGNFEYKPYYPFVCLKPIIRLFIKIRDWRYVKTIYKWIIWVFAIALGAAISWGVGHLLNKYFSTTKPPNKTEIVK